MPCVHFQIGNTRGIATMGGPDRKILVNGKLVLFEMHSYFGPILDRHGNPKERQPFEKHPFWPAFESWFNQGQRVGEDGVCIVDPVAEKKDRYFMIGPRSGLLVPDGVPDDEIDTWGRAKVAESLERAADRNRRRGR